MLMSARGKRSRNSVTSGPERTRPTVGGSAIATRPTGAVRDSSRSALALSTCCRMPRAWASSRVPAGVSVTPRPLRRNSACRNSTSRLRICRDSAGCAMERICAALEKLRASAT